MRRVMAIGAMLESCNFILFWRLVNGRYRPSESPDEPYKRPDEIKQMVESVHGFKEAIRLCQLFDNLNSSAILVACQVINVTFQRIYKHQLVNLLGGLDGTLCGILAFKSVVLDKELAGYSAHYKWRPLEEEGGQVYFIVNHEDTVKSRNIEERLSFESGVYYSLFNFNF